MNAKAIGRALRKRQPEIERALIDALTPLVHQSVAGHSSFERAESLRELLALSAGNDCNYDRPGIGVAYACWYHAKRMNDAVRLLIPILSDANDDVELLDLGCGTGSLWWAAAAIEQARFDLGGAPRTVRITAVDSSPAMLATAHALWEHLGGDRPTPVAVEASLASWLDEVPRADGAIAILSYVFDHTDVDKIEEITRRLALVLDNSRVTTALLATANSKRTTQNAIIKTLLASKAWTPFRNPTERAPFSGPILELGTLRAPLTSGVDNAELVEMGSNSPSWNDTATTYLRITRATHLQLVLDAVQRPSVTLDAEQEAAVELDSRPTAILGSAGSGKSRVLVERLRREVERRRVNRPLDILVTAFNRDLLDQLYAWFVEAQPDGLDETLSRACCGGTGHAVASDWRITFLNFDKVVRQHFGVPNHETTDDCVAYEKVAAALRAEEVAQLEVKGFDFPCFFADELHRVVYGLEATDIDSYRQVDRKGRGRPLRDADREAVWRVLHHPPRDKIFTWTDARLCALANAVAGVTAARFDRVFVDEAQDFVPADFRLLRALLRAEPSGLVVFGDGAQGLHVGTSHWLPPMSDHPWRKLHLQGSYRLPVKACAAIRPLSARLADHRSRALNSNEADVVVPHAMKAATPGTRPIIITGNEDELAEQLAEIATEYRLLVDPKGDQRVTLAEGANTLLADALKRELEGWIVETGGMQRIKGLERPWIVWSTDTAFRTRSTVAEWIFTILTRSTAVTVIALADATPPSTQAVVGRLDRESLLFWTQEAKATFDEFRTHLDTSVDPLRDSAG